jgi:hypothetical protein
VGGFEVLLELVKFHAQLLTLLPDLEHLGLSLCLVLESVPPLEIRQLLSFADSLVGVRVPE